MSNRIVDKSVKKPESAKSSKAVVNTGGYELIGKGKKSPNASGYHKPDARAVGGYELVKSPAGKKTGAVQNMELSYVSQVDQQVAQPKRDVVLIVAVLILTLFGIVAIMTIAVVFFVPEQETLKPLPDLSELCRQEQDPPKGVDRDCYFHNDKYPKYNCTRTTCSSVVYKLSVSQSSKYKDKLKKTIHLNKNEIRGLREIPNQTPCAPGKWCQDGQCVTTEDKRVKQYDEIKPTNSVWVNTCDKSKCIHIVDNSPLLQNIGNCTNRSDCQGLAGLQFVVFGFRHCSPPQHDGLYRPQEDLPIHVIKKCGSCPGNATGLKRDCKSFKSDFGFPCDENVTNTNGFCFGGKCVFDSSADEKCKVD